MLYTGPFTYISLDSRAWSYLVFDSLLTSADRLVTSAYKEFINDVAYTCTGFHYKVKRNKSSCLLSKPKISKKDC